MPATSAALVVPASRLMHAAVAYHSPELVAFDRIVSLSTQGTLHTTSGTSSSSSNIAALPIEVLLTIRSHLVPSLIATSATRLDAALTAFESALPERLCSECASYNAQVIGDAVWEWPNFCTGCDCPRSGQSALEAAIARHAATTGDASLHPRRQFKGPGDWIQHYVEREMLPTPAGAEERGLWPVVDDMLATVGCKTAFVSSNAEQMRNAIVEIVPLQGATDAALVRAEIEFGLDAEVDEIPVLSSSSQEPSMPILVPDVSKVSTFHWHAAPAPRAAPCTTFPVTGVVSALASRVRSSISATTSLGPRTVAAVRREPSLFGGFAVALAARLAYAVVA